MLAKRYPLLASSKDNTKVSLTLQSLIPLAVLIVGLLKLNIPDTDVETIIMTAGVVVNGCVTVYGIIRKYL